MTILQALGGSLPPAAILTLVFPYIGSFFASLLKQRHWPTWTKDTIAWVLLVMCAAINGIINGQISTNLNTLLPHLNIYFGILVSAIMLMISGPLTQLQPWLGGMVWVEAHLFNLPAVLPAVQPAPVPVTDQPTKPMPTAIPFPPTPTYQATEVIPTPKPQPGASKTTLPPSPFQNGG